MDKRTIERLEFDKVRSRLAACAGSFLGQQKALELVPITDLAVIRTWQQETSEGKQMLRMEPNLPLGGIKDVSSVLKKANLGVILEPQELLNTADTLRASRKLKNFILDRKELYPILAEMAVNLWVYRDIEDAIEKSILPGGEIADSASPDLHRLRSQIRGTQQRIKEKMDGFVRSSQNQKYLQEALVTMRDDRYVVPVKLEARGQVPGVVHDQSASGATLFIEPMAVVEANNELRRFRTQEQQEISRILANLSTMVAGQIEQIGETLETLAQLDFVFAKGKYSQSIDGGEPLINEEGKLKIILGRHPLIPGKVVPITISLGDKFDLLVITGPNTGGKTVTLKTAGLLTIMAQAGLHIPAEPGSEIAIFDQIFADIGDEQSIEQSLSTFSSHMTNIVKILAGLSGRALVLLDELGAGTDPTEGAALAQAILESLRLKGVRTIATTHYSELKTYAFARERVENAAVEFDLETLRPTYRLLIGQPGYSRAFPIAQRLGLAEAIINKAEEFLTQEQLQLAELIKSMEESKAAAEKEVREASRLRDEMTSMKNQYTEKFADFQSKKNALWKKAQEETAAIIRQAKRDAELIIAELKAKALETDAKTKARAVEGARAQLGTLAEVYQEKTPSVSHGQSPKSVKPGEQVFVPRLNQQGQVLTTLNVNGEVQVQLGIMKISLNLGELRKVKENPKAVIDTNMGKIMAGKSMAISTELDLRGLLVDEALEKVEKYLDDAFLAGLPRISIIHGKGTGALRKAIQEYLNNHSHIKSHRLGQHGEGGVGITIVDLK